MNSISSSPKTYFSNLDALRFFAFLAVFISHVALFLGYQSVGGYFQSIKSIFFVHGDLGVNFFFVLSGFLITFLLFSEKLKSNTVSLRHFYLRRVLRIWPLYFLILILGFFFIYPLAVKSGISFPFLTKESFSSLPWYIFLGVNIKMAFIGAGSVVLAVLWSISVEEQFYLVWPAVLSFIHDKKHILKVIFFIIIVAFLYRFYYHNHYTILKYSTFSVMSDLAIGALGAYITLFIPRIYNLIKNCPRYLIILVYICCLALIPLSSLFSNIFHGFLYRLLHSFTPTLFSLFFIFIILEQNMSLNSFLKFGRFKTLNYLGVRSYGLYCYHMIGIFFTVYLFNYFGIKNPNHNLIYYILEIITALVLTIVFASVSYRFFEKKFLNLKSKYGYQRV